MPNTPLTDGKKRYGGLGLFNIDLIVPTGRDIVKALKNFQVDLIRDLSTVTAQSPAYANFAAQLTQLAKSDDIFKPEEVKKVVAAYGAIAQETGMPAQIQLRADLLKELIGYQKHFAEFAGGLGAQTGAKKTLSIEDTAKLINGGEINKLAVDENSHTVRTYNKEKVTGSFQEMETIIEALNQEITEKNDRIITRRLGGTQFNKSNALMLARGNKVAGVIGGILGNDPADATQFIQEKMISLGITIAPSENFDGKIPANIVIPSGKGGRIVLKGNVPEYPLTEQQEKQILTAMAGLDCLMLEGSDLAKFPGLFEKLVDQAIEQKQNIIFSAPTNESLLETDEQRALFDKIIDYQGNRLMTMNEEEAMRMFAENAEQRTRAGGLDSNIIDPLNHDPRLNKAIEAIQSRLAEKKAALGENPSGAEPMAVISCGSHGACIITAEKDIRVPVEEPLQSYEKEISVGAGDNFAAGAIIARNALMVGKSIQGNAFQTFDEQDIIRILEVAQAFGREAVKQKAAYLPKEKIDRILEDFNLAQSASSDNQPRGAGTSGGAQPANQPRGIAP